MFSVRDRGRAGGESLVTGGVGGRAVAAVTAVAALLAFAALSAAGSGDAAAAAEPAAAEAEAAALTVRGFLRDKRDRFTTIAPPGAVATKATGLSDRGELVGIGYPSPVGNAGGFGFLRDKHGAYTSFVFPGTGPESRTVASSINNRGQIAGWSDDGLAGFGFIRDGNGAFTRIEHPDANGTAPDGLGTEISGTDVRAISDHGEVVGNFVADGTIYGFLRDRRGRFTTIRHPRAAATLITNISDRGAIVGAYSEVGPEELATGTARSFVMSKGVYREIAFPGALATAVNGITNGGKIAGSYVDALGTVHGFVRGGRGDYTAIEHPDAAGLGTAVYDINERGQTTGAYLSPVEQTQAFRQAQRAGGGQMANPLSDLRFTR